MGHYDGKQHLYISRYVVKSNGVNVTEVLNFKTSCTIKHYYDYI